MDEKIGNPMEHNVVKAKNVSVQVTTIKLTKDNYLRQAIVITMRITRRGWIDYIDGKKVQPEEDECT